LSAAAPELVRLSAEHAPALAVMLAELRATGETRWFDPHPGDLLHLRDHLCRDDMLDLHYVLRASDGVLAYGLLRGWDEGFEVPSLGVAVSPAARGLGLGELMMRWLHLAAERRGSRRVRLRVSRDNARAIALYERTGYIFAGADGPLLTGFKQLTPA
jgi:[ribosomal protein S18]-alanine N-acetyltransferase